MPGPELHRFEVPACRYHSSREEAVAGAWIEQVQSILKISSLRRGTFRAHDEHRSRTRTIRLGIFDLPGNTERTRGQPDDLGHILIERLIV